MVAQTYWPNSKEFFQLNSNFQTTDGFMFYTDVWSQANSILSLSVNFSEIMDIVFVTITFYSTLWKPFYLLSIFRD